MTPEAALKKLAALSDEWRRTKAAFDEVDRKVKTAIVQARKAGATPTATEDTSPLSPATTRKVTRAADIEPGRPGGRPSS